MQVQLSWIDPETNTQQQPLLNTPVALGRTFEQMPTTLKGKQVARIVLRDPRVDDFHAVIAERKGRLMVADRHSVPTIAINGRNCTGGELQDGDRLFISPFEIEIRIVSSRQGPSPPIRTPESLSSPVTSAPGCDKRVGFLFPRRCGRLSPEGCPHCNGGEIDREPYFLSSERSLYPNYGDYSQGESAVPLDFTDADAMSLETVGTDFEQDMGAS
ncbi:MAG: FHA domain-containing protein [Cyanobacteriota bacterium]|nr:FHA domain-containing protein [Cyanobacteriota bacterium]